jgi:hypothetical protein
VSAEVGPMPSTGQAKRRSAAQPENQPVKRTRVSRACDQCRVAREKCDGAQPVCSTCIDTKRRCSYTANPKKRGIQPGYIRTLELSLAYLFQQNPGNEALLNGELAKDGPSSLLLGRDSKESNRLHKRWRKTRFYTDIDKQLSGGEPSRYEQPKQRFSPSSDEASDTNADSVVDMSRNQGQNEDTQADVESSGLEQLNVVEQHAAYLALNDATQVQLQQLQAESTAEWPQFIAQDRIQPLRGYMMPYQHHAIGMQMPTLGSLPSLFPPPQPLVQPASDTLDSFFPGPHSMTTSLLTTTGPSQTNLRYPEVTSNLETFFDELASLDNATRPEGQPQFMQNLGFGPEASMTDLFS